MDNKVQFIDEDGNKTDLVDNVWIKSEVYWPPDKDELTCVITACFGSEAYCANFTMEKKEYSNYFTKNLFGHCLNTLAKKFINNE